MYWLPEIPDWTDRLRAVSKSGTCDWTALTALANARLDFTATLQLDRVVQKHKADAAGEGLTAEPLRLAVLGSSTVEHLLPGLRMGALRRGIPLATYTSPCGQYLQDFLDPSSGLAAFAPDAILITLDARH